ncbi:uncharacterized protein LOC141696591 [Apium graveolens]|uniref:uncharacterized protein LOC141696591 n=1 Tax=Apium graveolens TaxID=4045 RepID=UPI003D7BAB51
MKTHFTEPLKSSTANSSNKEYSTIRDTEIPDADCYSDDVTLKYASLGPPSVKCSKCEAWMWKEEHVNKYCSKGIPEFSIYYGKGEIQLPKEKPTLSYMWQLFNDKRTEAHFQDCIRMYNNLFAFASCGGRIDHSVNCGGAPYIYRLNGQNHHLFGSLIPDEGQPPKFCQLYIYGTANETNNRLRWINVHDGKTIKAEIIKGLTKMLDDTNELMHEFMTQRDRFEQDKVIELEITLKISRSDSGRENHIVPADDLAGIMVGDLDENCKTPRLGGRLYQQYVVDAFLTIEQARLWWFREHQTTLRNELYRKISDSVRSGEVDSCNVGKGIKLPAGFVGSRRYSPNTTFDDSGFPIYRRRKTDVTVNVRKEDLDNKWVVPYNRNLLVKYQCHMNVEICCHASSIKYLFKY